MHTITKILIGICIAFVIFIIILLILHFKESPKNYITKHSKKNNVDAEIEKELKRNKDKV
ncbi:hypothetical protein C8N46_1179 [Kordia periserrulae]|uniref:Uncharacterized protein n=1 Tax=Kordia periserrulae TaxID=701523 RepID=A0A2T6BQ50_9FLAO|nr:hypothetical protein C8N46_1179 [Kordia periserrulae]